jgi:hypothetical protein
MPDWPYKLPEQCKEGMRAADELLQVVQTWTTDCHVVSPVTTFVPEPSTTLALVAGCLLLAAGRWVRREG